MPSPLNSDMAECEIRYPNNRLIKFDQKAIEKALNTKPKKMKLNTFSQKELITEHLEQAMSDALLRITAIEHDTQVLPIEKLKGGGNISIVITQPITEREKL